MKQETFHAIQRAQLITRHYHELQGFKQIPIGLLFLLLAADNAGWWPWFSSWQPISGLVATGLCFLGTWRIHRYYDQEIGRVTYRADNRRHVPLILVAIGAVSVASTAETVWNWPVSASGLVVAASFALVFWFTGRILFHYLVVASLVALASILPLTGLLAANQVYLFGSESVLLMALIGLGFISCGILDHWWLTRALPPSRARE
jgi:uncharacterized membrane protein